MVARLLIGLFAVTCFHLSTEGARISNCEFERKNVEGYSSPKLNCYFNSTATVRWTVVKETGATLHLATCYRPDNCRTPYNSSDLQVVRINSFGYVKFYKIGSQFSGELICQETLTNGTVLTDTCQLNVARVSLPLTPWFLRENKLNIITCNTFGYNSSIVTWSLTTTSGQTLDLGTCTDVGSCTSPLAPEINTRRTDRYKSTVSFPKMDRSRVGQLFCSYAYNNLKETDNTTLVVYQLPTVKNCHAELHLRNWSTILSCDISHVFSSSGYYYFSLFEDFEVIRNMAGRRVTDGRLSYRDMLTPYTNSTNKKLYYRGRLTHSWPLLPIQTIYTRLDVDFYASTIRRTNVYVDYAVNITPPSQPTHNCSELNYIPETGVVPCVCTADYLGSPAGRLVWLLGNITIATGDYGITQLTFPSGKVSRQHNGMMVTCQLDWVQPMTTEFERHVAYGPDNVTLQVIPSRDVSSDTLINVTSYVSSMKPLSAGIVQWGGLCQGQQGFTCTLTTRSAAEVDGKAVTCSVTNTANNRHRAETSVIIKILGFTQAHTKRDGFNGTAVGLGIVLGIVVIAFVVVMIILYRRGSLCTRPTQNAPTSQDDDDSHIYTGLKISKVTKNKRKGAKKGVSCPSVVYQGDGDTVYENTTMGGQGGHM